MLHASAVGTTGTNEMQTMERVALRYALRNLVATKNQQKLQSGERGYEGTHVGV